VEKMPFPVFLTNFLTDGAARKRKREKKWTLTKTRPRKLCPPLPMNRGGIVMQPNVVVGIPRPAAPVVLAPCLRLGRLSWTEAGGNGTGPEGTVRTEALPSGSTSEVIASQSGHIGGVSGAGSEGGDGLSRRNVNVASGPAHHTTIRT